MREAYERHIHHINAPGSHKASSYMRALDLLAEILAAPNPLYPNGTAFWEVRAADELARLYDTALREQKNQHGMFHRPGLPQSYGMNGYYSAALKSYAEFLATRGFEQRLMAQWRNLQVEPGELVAARLEQELDDDEFSAELARLQARSAEDLRREVRTRVCQNVFRDILLENYQGRCAVTGLAVQQVLRASHIVAWSEEPAHRLNPSNGLLLSATYDAAFDQHLLTFDEAGRMVLSPSLKAHHGHEAFRETFGRFEGLALARPLKFPPSEVLMARHREKLVA
jgi:putative restriction endonuclease